MPKVHVSSVLLTRLTINLFIYFVSKETDLILLFFVSQALFICLYNGSSTMTRAAFNDCVTVSMLALSVHMVDNGFSCGQVKPKTKLVFAACPLSIHHT